MRPLLQHQIDGERFLDRRNGRGALFMEPGLGKTRVAIRRALRGRMVAFSTLDSCLIAWPEQCREWAGDLSWRVVRGSPKEREQILFDEKPDIAIINYELSHWFYDLIAERRKMPYDILCLDESSAVKNGESIAHRALIHLEHAFDEVVPMNGTPAGNSLHDVWGQLRFVGGGETLGEKVGVFRERYCRPVVRENYVRWAVARPEELRRDAAPYCFVRRANDCLDMPDLSHVDVRFDLNDRERHYYDRMKRHHVIPSPDPVLLENAGVELDKLRQVCSGFVYIEDKIGRKVTHGVGRSKAKVLQSCVEECQGRPILIGFWYQGSKSMARTHIESMGIDAPVYDRFTPLPLKRRLMDQWRRGELPVLLGQIRTVAKSHNMQSPDASVLFYDMPWSHEYYWQFIRRVWRQGQRTRVVVRRLIARNTCENYVAWVLKQKQAEEEALQNIILEEEVI